jgi:hypothetical protein
VNRAVEEFFCVHFAARRLADDPVVEVDHIEKLIWIRLLDDLAHDELFWIGASR